MNDERCLLLSHLFLLRFLILQIWPKLPVDGDGGRQQQRSGRRRHSWTWPSSGKEYFVSDADTGDDADGDDDDEFLNHWPSMKTHRPKNMYFYKCVWSSVRWLDG